MGTICSNERSSWSSALQFANSSDTPNRTLLVPQELMSASETQVSRPFPEATIPRTMLAETTKNLDSSTLSSVKLTSSPPPQPHRPPVTQPQNLAPRSARQKMIQAPLPPPITPALSRHAQLVIQRVEGVLQKYSNVDLSKCGADHIPTEEEEMYEILISLRNSVIGLLFINHPEVTLSNRCCVITTADFSGEESVAGYRLRGAFGPGTIGRSYLVTSEADRDEPSAPKYILKVVSFVLRKSLVDDVVMEQRVLVHTNYENVVKIEDVLNDEFKENIVVVTTYNSRQNIVRYAGKLDNDPEKLRRIIYDVGAALRLIHSHHIYHHNLKLENVLETNEGRFCIADAGFSRLFTSQCPEALVFNGELAGLPPEVFDEHYPYADGSLNACAQDPSHSTSPFSGYGRHSVAPKVDVWGLGILIYRLVYNAEPFLISQCSYDEVQARICKQQPTFPAKPWSFAGDLEAVMLACLTKNPEKRPTVLELLRHPFFKDSPSVTIPSTPPGGSFFAHIPRVMSGASSTAMGASFARHASLSLTSKNQTRNGYTVDSYLGRGKYSETMLVHLRRNSSQHYALKMINQSVLKRMKAEDDDSRAQRILKQLAATRKMSHPNIVKYIEIVDGARGDCFVVQEYVKGGTLRCVPHFDAPKGKPQLLQLLADVLVGLVYLHDNEVPHMYLTPSNILYTEELSARQYKLVDYGPLFITTEEIAQSATRGEPLRSLPAWIMNESPINGFHVDTFSVGLLAASSLPKLFSVVWPQLTCVDGYTPLSVDCILQSIKDPIERVPPKLVELIEVAITQPTSARALLQLPYFENKYPLKSLPIRRVQVSPSEIIRAIQSKPEIRDESRVMDILGQDPYLEGQMLTSEVDFTESTTSPDKYLLDFTGPNPRCGQCDQEVPLVFYVCLWCPGYIRCGKCSVHDTHKLHHTLQPYVVHTVEHTKDKGRATLLPISPLQNVHALETLEMSANLPQGTLCKHVNSQRIFERSVRGRDVSALLLSGPDFGSVTQVQELDNSTSNANKSRSSTSLKMNSTSNFYLPPVVNGGASSSRTSQTTTPANEGKRAPFGNFKKAATLPKASEVEDTSWEEELEQCRETRNPDLLLFNFDLDEVPKDVYSPPLLHVVFLDLSQNSLTVLPHELSFLKSLQRLTISYNKLSALPESIGNLAELEAIDASHNNLTELPMTFAYLSNLQLLALDYNDFSEIPESILEIVPQNLPPTETSPVSTGAGDFCSLVRFPAISVLYLAANPRITALPPNEKLERFRSLKIAVDNEPSFYRQYMENNLENKLPNITISWNKIYPDEIIPHLFCGSLRTTQSQMVYQKLNITHLLTVGRGLLPIAPKGGVSKTVVVDDIPGANIMSSMKDSIEFIDKCLAKGEGCLVHCFAGLSRSATTVIAYLMVAQKLRLDDAYLLTRKGRPAILPNKGFFEQLLRLDAELYPNARPLDLAPLGRPDE